MKKQPIIIFAIIFLVSIFFFSCGNRKKDQIGKIEFNKIEVNESGYLLEDTISPNCNLTIEYTYPVKTKNPVLADSVNKALINYCFGEKYDGLDITAVIDSFKNDYVRSYKADLQSLYKEDMTNNPNEKVTTWYSYYLNMDTEPISGNPAYLIYRINKHEYTGGAHGHYFSEFMNFDPLTGHLLTLDDVFKPGYYEAINEKLLIKLSKQAGASGAEELMGKGYLQWSEMYPSKTFYLDKGGILFFYNIYEIAPYSMGTTELTLPYSEVKEWLKIDY